MNSNQEIIPIEALKCSYGGEFTLEVDLLSLPTSGCLGLIGPNGAGKSTLLKCLSRTTRFEALRMPILTKSQTGVLIDAPPVFNDCRVIDFLTLACHLKNIAPNDEIERIDKFFFLGHLLKKFMSDLSKGQKQLIGIAQTFIGNPSIILLDEPGAGLDPEVSARVRSLINLEKKNRLFIVSSHLLSEFQQVFDRALFLKNGHIIGDENIATLNGHELYALYSEIMNPSGDLI